MACEVEIHIQHEFSVEVDDFKRKFLMSAHAIDGQCGFHLFEDVAIFNQEDDQDHLCHTCQAKHKIPGTIDILVAGPSCKDISKENVNRAKYTGCCLVDSCCVNVST